jgi:hypothetical protein
MLGNGRTYEENKRRMLELVGDIDLDLVRDGYMLTEGYDPPTRGADGRNYQRAPQGCGKLENMGFDKCGVDGYLCDDCRSGRKPSPEPDFGEHEAGFHYHESRGERETEVLIHRMYRAIDDVVKAGVNYTEIVGLIINEFGIDSDTAHEILNSVEEAPAWRTPTRTLRKRLSKTS